MAYTSATTTLWIGSTLPTTHDDAGFSAGTITWTKVTECSDLGTIGGKTNVVSFTDVSTGKITKRGGAQDFGQMTVKAARHSGADLTALRAAFADRAPRAFKVIYPALIGETEFFTGVVTSVPTSIGGADSILEMNITIDLDDEIVTVAA
jgi:hypothetical protein